MIMVLRLLTIPSLPTDSKVARGYFGAHHMFHILTDIVHKCSSCVNITDMIMNEIK